MKDALRERLVAVLAVASGAAVAVPSLITWPAAAQAQEPRPTRCATSSCWPPHEPRAAARPTS